MKKTISLITALLMIAALFGSCGEGGVNKNDENSEIQIVTTVFPIYDWVRNIIGTDNENIELTMLLDSGTDLHSFQPSAADIMKVADCDMFIYVGGESDEWVDDVLKEKTNTDMKLISLMTELGEALREERTAEGMEPEEEEGEGEEETEYDEHIWLSLKNASALCKKISAEIAELDTENASVYLTNAEEYCSQIEALDKEYESTVSSVSKSTLVFADRFPFEYLCADYGIDYYAAFKGCSAESEASFKTITFLAEKIDELGLGFIIKIDSSDGSVAKTVRENTKQKTQEILTLNSLQSVTAEQANETAYVDVMRENLQIIKTALS